MVQHSPKTRARGSDGSYSDVYYPTEIGVWRIAASWEGDSAFQSATSQTLTYTVIEPPPSCSLKITILDEKGNPITGTSVSFTSTPTGQPSLSDTSGLDGIVTFDDVMVGTYTLQIEASGHKKTTLGVRTSIGITTEASVTLEKESPSMQKEEPSVIEEQPVEEEPSGGGGIPGFPYESIILGLVAGVVILWMMQRRNYPPFPFLKSGESSPHPNSSPLILRAAQSVIAGCAPPAQGESKVLKDG